MDMALVRHVWWTDDQQRQCGSAQDPLGDTPRRPALQPAVPMRRHGDHVAATEYACPLCVFPVLRQPDDGTRHICINRHRPGNGEVEVCYSGHRQAFMQMLYHRTQVAFRPMQDLLAARACIEVLYSTLSRHGWYHPYQVQCSCCGSSERGDQGSSRLQGGIGVCRTVQCDQGAQRAYGVWMRASRDRSTLAQDEHGHISMTCHFLRDTAQNPARHACIAMAAQHNQVGPGGVRNI